LEISLGQGRALPAARDILPKLNQVIVAKVLAARSRL
jgi:hypothetical protein